MDPGGRFVFTLRDGTRRTIELERTWARLHNTTLKTLKVGELGARSVLRMHCRIRIDGRAMDLVRWVGSRRSYYEPWELMGMRLWFDGCVDLLEFLNENTGPAVPSGTRGSPCRTPPWRSAQFCSSPGAPFPEGD